MAARASSARSPPEQTAAATVPRSPASITARRRRTLLVLCVAAMLVVPSDSYHTINAAGRIEAKLSPATPRKVEAALGAFEKNVDTAELTGDAHELLGDGRRVPGRLVRPSRPLGGRGTLRASLHGDGRCGRRRAAGCSARMGRQAAAQAAAARARRCRPFLPWSIARAQTTRARLPEVGRPTAGRRRPAGTAGPRSRPSSRTRRGRRPSPRRSRTRAPSRRTPPRRP